MAVRASPSDVGARVGDGRVTSVPADLASGRLRVQGLPHGDYEWSASRNGRGVLRVRPGASTVESPVVR